MRVLENIPLVLLRDLSAEQIELPSNKTAIHKASLKEILLEDRWGTQILPESDRLLVTKTIIPFKKKKYNKILKQISMSLHLGQY